jgi:hypothetical protein
MVLSNHFPPSSASHGLPKAGHHLVEHATKIGAANDNPREARSKEQALRFLHNGGLPAVRTSARLVDDRINHLQRNNLHLKLWTSALPIVA